MSRTARETQTVLKSSPVSKAGASSGKSTAVLAPTTRTTAGKKPRAAATLAESPRQRTRASATAIASAIAPAIDVTPAASAKPAAKPAAKLAAKLGATPAPTASGKSVAKPAAGAKPSASANASAKAGVAPQARAKPAARPERNVERTVVKSSAAAAAATRAAKAPPKPLTLAERPIDQVWREYRVSPTEEVRNFLIGRHLDLVAYAAERLHKRLPSEVEINDLKSAGAFGLMDAVESFDPDRGVKFETYCTQRIRGAMFDELRSMDWVPRLVRSRTAKVEKVRKSIEMETGARPTEDEVAARLNVSGDEFEKLQKDSRPISMVSLTRKCFETDSSKDVREIDVVEDGRQENPLQAVQKLDLQQLITKGLSRAERLIVILYYYEEMTMKEIGATLDLSESRVSQMHSSILARLKAQMQHRELPEE